MIIILSLPSKTWKLRLSTLYITKSSQGAEIQSLAPKQKLFTVYLTCTPPPNRKESVEMEVFYFSF